MPEHPLTTWTQDWRSCIISTNMLTRSLFRETKHVSTLQLIKVYPLSLIRIFSGTYDILNSLNSFSQSMTLHTHSSSFSESPLISSWSRFNDVATCSHLPSLALKAVLKTLTKGLDGKNLNALNPEIYWHDPRSTHTIESHTWLPGSLASRNPTWMLCGPKSLHLGKRTPP